MRMPFFLFVHIDNVDAAGHEFGHESQKYYDAVSKADIMIDKIFKNRSPNKRLRDG